MKKLMQSLTSRRGTRITIAAVMALALGTTVRTARSQQAASDGEIHSIAVQGNVHMLVGPAGNIAAQIGKQGIVLVDTQIASASQKILAALARLSDKQIRYIINTHFDPEHVGGNDNLRRAGMTVAGANVAANLTDASQGAAIIANERVLDRMSAPEGKQPAMPFGAWPTVTYAGQEKELFFNDESIQILHQPAANTDGDSIVYFRRSDVIATGDIFSTAGYPMIDIEKGGSIQGIIRGLNAILHIAIPAHEQEDGTLVIPGHGRVCDEADVVEYRDMVVIVRDRIRAMLKKGATLDQVKAAKPTYEWDGRYGSTSGPWTTDRFIEASYKNLAGK